ncbi:hypothetical protein AA313_de0200436 [Arthrobotrys entomopaga]|nr:hypothetical protein AA313_de0200436 [Arthrobotrys entomopaga]
MHFFCLFASTKLAFSGVLKSIRLWLKRFWIEKNRKSINIVFCQTSVFATVTFPKKLVSISSYVLQKYWWLEAESVHTHFFQGTSRYFMGEEPLACELPIGVEVGVKKLGVSFDSGDGKMVRLVGQRYQPSTNIRRVSVVGTKENPGLDGRNGGSGYVEMSVHATADPKYQRISRSRTPRVLPPARSFFDPDSSGSPYQSFLRSKFKTFSGNIIIPRMPFLAFRDEVYGNISRHFSLRSIPPFFHTRYLKSSDISLYRYDYDCNILTRVSWSLGIIYQLLEMSSYSHYQLLKSLKQKPILPIQSSVTPDYKKPKPDERQPKSSLIRTRSGRLLNRHGGQLVMPVIYLISERMASRNNEGSLRRPPKEGVWRCFCDLGWQAG